MVGWKKGREFSPSFQGREAREVFSYICILNLFDLKYLEIYSQRGHLSIALVAKLLVCEICWSQGDKHLAFMRLHDIRHVLKKRLRVHLGSHRHPQMLIPLQDSAAPRWELLRGWVLEVDAYCICAYQCSPHNEHPRAPTTAVSGSLSPGQEGCWALQLPFLLTGKMVLCQVTAVATNCKAH